MSETSDHDSSNVGSDNETAKEPDYGVPGLVRMGPNPNGFSIWHWATIPGSLDETLLDPAADHMRSGDAIYVTTGRDVVHRRVVIADHQVHVLPIN